MDRPRWQCLTADILDAAPDYLGSMSIRRIIFWMHLCAGLSAGMVIMSMAATGVLMTYERQIVAALELQSGKNALGGSALNERASMDKLARSAADAFPDARSPQLVIRREKEAPVAVLSGRSTIGYLNPATGEKIETSASAARDCFAKIRGFHRWLAFDGKKNDVGKAVTGAANLVFIFIIISGLYLWLPKVLRWSALRSRMFFSKSYPNAHTRNFHWHHIFAVWSFIVLFFAATTATVFSYDWASDLVYKAVGEEPPSQRRRPTPKETSLTSDQSKTDLSAVNRLSLEELFQIVAGSADSDWRRIRFQIPANSPSEKIEFTLDHGSGGEPTKRTVLALNRVSGSIVSEAGFSDIPAGRRARIFIRYLHTGEALGLVGQTLMSMASLAACFLFYTGFSLSYRRFIKK
ncbi:MAG: PepSY-associated TM helix domain-containing protein [Pseudomonadota bacterium]